MFEDFEKIKSVPIEFRWFVQSDEDEIFLLNQTLKVWENPKAPSEHEKEFLVSCIDYIKTK